ncbi:MAG TPA: dienelactone hydrolase family protein [Luteimonas sp.]|nr:dienelactone hydrolase family protein [Luteimonas sp.]
MATSRNAILRRAALLLALSSLPAAACAAMQAKPVEWKVGDQAFSGVLVYDDASADKRPGLVMVPDWLGVTPDAVAQAKEVAGDDYVILVADIYGKGVRPKNDGEAEALVTKLSADTGTLRARTAKAVAVLEAQAGKAPLDVAKIGAFGYCFGGSSVLELARSGARLAGIVTFHGGLQTKTPARPGAVKTPLLVLNGGDDRGQMPNVPGFEKEMDAAGADWTLVNFSGAVHCFALKAANKPPGCVYDPRAARRAYRMMRGFWDERFGED